MDKSTKHNKIRTRAGFTIVELLVVIVVIGILAAITIVSYTGVTARANKASAVSVASNVISKANIFNADGPTSNWPTTYTQLTQAASTEAYYMTGINFTKASNASSNATMTSTMNNSTHMNIDPKNTVDFMVCGTNAGAAPTNYYTLNTITGMKIGFWDYTNTTPQVDNTTYVGGTVSGGNVTCYKVGIAEAVVATAKSYFADNGSWPTYAQLSAFTTGGAVGAKLPSGLTVTGALATTTIDSVAEAPSNVTYNCANGGCAANGGRIGFYNTVTPGIEYIYFGGATAASTPFVAG